MPLVYLPMNLAVLTDLVQHHCLLQQHPRLHGSHCLGRRPQGRRSLRSSAKRRMLHGDVIGSRGARDERMNHPKGISRRPTAQAIFANLRDTRSMTNPGEDSLLPFALCFFGVHTRRKGDILCEKTRGLERWQWHGGEEDTTVFPPPPQSEGLVRVAADHG